MWTISWPSFDALVGYKSRLGQDKDGKTPGDGVTPAILQRSDAKPERVVTWGFAGRWQARG